MSKTLELHCVLSVGGFRDIDHHTYRVCFVIIVQELVVYFKCNTNILTYGSSEGVEGWVMLQSRRSTPPGSPIVRFNLGTNGQKYH